MDNKHVVPTPLGFLIENDVWVREFVHECCILFGMPCTLSECLTKSERYMYTFALMSVTAGMRRMDDVWRGMYKKVKPKVAAMEFARRFNSKYDKMLVARPAPHTVKQTPASVNTMNINVVNSGSSH
jgi:hypothetical protein